MLRIDKCFRFAQGNKCFRFAQDDKRFRFAQGDRRFRVAQGDKCFGIRVVGCHVTRNSPQGVKMFEMIKKSGF
jgi:hypothetical protein